MKKCLAVLLLVLSSGALADGYYTYSGILMGNVCRTGLYYFVTPYFYPVGSTCWNPTVGGYGVIQTN